MTTLCLYYVCFLLLVCKAQIFDDRDYPNDYQTYPPDMAPDVTHLELYRPEAVRQHSGSFVILKCTVPNCRRHRHSVSWDFKPCKADFNNVPCDKFHGEAYENTLPADIYEWIHIRSFKARKCTHQLDITNINTTNNGLYRCRINGQTLKTFEVEVIETIDYNEEPPIVLDLVPSNSSVPMNTQVIIQCRVYSQHPPAIWWFKQSDGTIYDIKYAENFYSRINTTTQAYPVPNDTNVYLSKLNIQNISLIDSGVYVCVGITEQGINLKNAVIRVLGNNVWEPRMSFSLLFLIPLAFALVPITVWLCYYRKKRKSVEVINMQQQKKLNNSRMPVVRHSLFSNKIVNKSQHDKSSKFVNASQSGKSQSVI